MALTQPQIAQSRADFARDQYGPGASLVCKFTKADLDAAASAIDAWIDANQVSFNNALPAPFKAGAAAIEKAALFNFVALRRLRG